MSKELRDKIFKEMEEIPEEWKSKFYKGKLHKALTTGSIYYTHYGPGREFTEGYDWIYVYFDSKMSAKIFLNKHHESCF